MYEDLLLKVNKPGRYIGREWNTPRKDFRACRIKFGLCFPDLYEVGMSNLGLRILYGILNKMEDTSCERFFSPGRDMEEVIRQEGKEIRSLESGSRLGEFDLIGFSLGSELCFTNVLNVLDLAGMPLKSEMRDNSHPLVIGGGPCSLNPEPMHAFFDLFVIGEAEEALCEIVDVYRSHQAEYKSFLISKKELLLKLSRIEGVYIPSFYKTEYSHAGDIRKFEPEDNSVPRIVKKRIVAEFENSYFPSDWLVPYIQIVHDRLTMELMRGCPNRCRFCQARSQYFPLRQRSVEKVFSLCQESYRKTGYEEISLIGLSVSDYPEIEELLRILILTFKQKGVSVSLPSVKPKTLVGQLSSLISTIKKTGLTFAPEAATERLRLILGKDFNEDEFFDVLEKAYFSGYQHVKLYFMIGLPGENEADLDAILDFSARVSGMRKKIGLGAAQVNISVNALIPKPHTPFQWLGMEDIETVRYKQDYLRKKNRNRKLKLSFHNCYMSYLEGVFSRGDRRLSEVVMRAFKNGARFDAWDESFNFERWLEAFRHCGIDPDSYIREKDADKLMPWSFIDTGVPHDYLLSEFNKAIA